MTYFSCTLISLVKDYKVCRQPSIESTRQAICKIQPLGALSWLLCAIFISAASDIMIALL